MTPTSESPARDAVAMVRDLADMVEAGDAPCLGDVPQDNLVANAYVALASAVLEAREELTGIPGRRHVVEVDVQLTPRWRDLLAALKEAGEWQAAVHARFANCDRAWTEVRRAAAAMLAEADRETDEAPTSGSVSAVGICPRCDKLSAPGDVHTCSPQPPAAPAPDAELEDLLLTLCATEYDRGSSMTLKRQRELAGDAVDTKEQIHALFQRRVAAAAPAPTNSAPISTPLVEAAPDAELEDATLTRLLEDMFNLGFAFGREEGQTITAREAAVRLGPLHLLDRIHERVAWLCQRRVSAARGEVVGTGILVRRESSGLLDVYDVVAEGTVPAGRPGIPVTLIRGAQECAE